MLRDRLITASIALPLVVFITLYAPTPVFLGIVALIALIGVLECFSIIRPEADLITKAMAGAGGTGIFVCASMRPEVVGLFLSCAFVGLGIYFLIRFKDVSLVINDCAIMLFTWVYVPFLLSHIVRLHALPEGNKLVFMVLLLTMVCDSCAYFVGTRWGRHRLYPAVSPKKSVEGALGGVAGAIVAAMFSEVLYLQDMGLLHALGIGLVAGIFAQTGDLFESLLKRSAQIKDSGRLFPGHGGMLDRLDSLLFTFPTVYLYVFLVF